MKADLERWVVLKAGEWMSKNCLCHIHPPLKKAFPCRKDSGEWECPYCREKAPEAIQLIADLCYCASSKHWVMPLQKEKVD